MEGYQLKDLARAIVHSILFQRLIHISQPRVVDLDAYHISYSRVVDPAVERTVESTVSALVASAAESPEWTPQVHVLFYDRKERKGWLLQRQGNLETHCWERWIVTFKVVTFNDNDSERQRQGTAMCQLTKAGKQRLIDQLQAALLYIPSMCGPSTPPSLVDDSERYPFRLHIPSGGGAGGGGESLTSLFKKLLSESSIPPILG